MCVKTMSFKITYQKNKKTKPIAIQRRWRCIWCGIILQVPTNRFEKKEKDFCNIYCNKPYYHFMKRLNQPLENSNLALSTDELDDRKNEVLTDLIIRKPAKPLNQLFMKYTKIVRRKIARDPVLKKNLIVKRELALSMENSKIETKKEPIILTVREF